MGHISVRSARLEAGGHSLLDALDFEAKRGEMTAVVGANGAGKTTLLRALAGLIRPVAGTIALDGTATSRIAPGERARRLAILSGDGAATPAVSVREAVATGRFAHHQWWDWRRTADDAAATERALSRVGLEALADRPFDSLSSGEQQRAWIALALAQGAGVLLLDEPTSHLDARYAHEVLRLLRDVARGGATVVVVLHDLNEAAAYCDAVALLGEGRLLAFGAPGVAMQPVTLQRAFGVRFVAADIAGAWRVFADATNDARVEGLA